MYPPAATGLHGAERALRAAVALHAFSEPQGRILDTVLQFTCWEAEPHVARIPRQDCFCIRCRLSRPKVSAELDALVRCRVIEERAWAGRRAYGMLTPAGWRVALRARDERLVRANEEWLERLRAGDLSQQELLAAEAGLDELLRCEFVARAAATDVTGCAAARPGGPQVTGSYPTGNWPVTSQVTAGDGSRSPPGAVTSQVTGSSIDRSINRIESTEDLESNDRSKARKLPTRYDPHAEEELYKLIERGREPGCERFGSGARLWRRALEHCPQDVLEGIATVQDLERTGRRVMSPAAWMNTFLGRRMAVERRASERESEQKL